MYTIKAENGAVIETSDIDINVWYDEQSDAVRLTGYPMAAGSDGYLTTNVGVILFSAETSFSPEDYADEWFGWADAMPGEIPGEVSHLVSSILDEIEVR